MSTTLERRLLELERAAGAGDPEPIVLVVRYDGVPPPDHYRTTVLDDRPGHAPILVRWPSESVRRKSILRKMVESINCTPLPKSAEMTA